jgi:hypothetical protein
VFHCYLSEAALNSLETEGFCDAIEPRDNDDGDPRLQLLDEALEDD